jgi:hypothetical protein
LFIKPKANGSPNFWKYDQASSRGWNGPYLNSNGLKLHGYNNFDNIYAIADSFSVGFKEVNTQLGGAAYWAVEANDQKKYYPGSPYVLLKNNGTYYLISNGLDATLESTSNDIAYDTDIIIDLGP